MSDIYQKAKNYMNLIKSIQDKDGFIESTECDSLLFSSLIGCVSGIKVNVDAAFDKTTGQWNRRPCDRPCFPDHSKSTISRDMLLGLLYYSFYNKRLDITEQLIKHALKNFGIVGKAIDFKSLMGRCFLTPGFLSTAAWISYRLGGPSRPWLRYLPQVESKSVVGFQAHLSVIHILLRNELTGKDNNKNLLEKHYARNPNNPLFCLATKRTEEAIASLSREDLWPTDRLPTNRDRKEAWLLQRDAGNDWLPDLNGEVKLHSGADFLFCYWLITQFN